MNNLTIISAIALSIIWHEACHALALLALGVPVRVIQIGVPVVYRRGCFALGLFPFYGAVGAEDLTGVPWAAQVLYYASGPIGSMILGVLLFIDSYTANMVGLVSLSIGIFNLLPVPPMDGYRLITLGRQVPYQVQIAWAVAGWTLIAVATFWWSW